MSRILIHQNGKMPRFQPVANQMLDATRCLKVRAIRLESASFDSLDGISETILEQERYTVQTRRATTFKFVDRDDARFLLGIVRFGVRLINPADEGSAGDVIFYSIEAGFVAEFEVVSQDYDEAGFEEFIDKNVAHVVWPFWRQHVYSTLQTACLPLLPIPLMAGLHPTARISKESADLDLSEDGTTKEP